MVLLVVLAIPIPVLSAVHMPATMPCAAARAAGRVQLQPRYFKSMVISSYPADCYGGCHGAIGLIGHSNAGAQCCAVYRELAGIEMGKPGRAVVAAKPS